MDAFSAIQAIQQQQEAQERQRIFHLNIQWGHADLNRRPERSAVRAEAEHGLVLEGTARRVENIPWPQAE